MGTGSQYTGAVNVVPEMAVAEAVPMLSCPSPITELTTAWTVPPSSKPAAKLSVLPAIKPVLFPSPTVALEASSETLENVTVRGAGRMARPSWE